MIAFIGGLLSVDLFMNRYAHDYSVLSIPATIQPIISAP